MRKQNLSVYDIESALKDQQTPLSATAIWEILREQGFSRLPRRLDQERPNGTQPEPARVADRREFTLTARHFQTQLGGLFLFLPFLVRCDLPGLVARAGYPGSKMIPATQALLSLLALFAGLNAAPKTTYLSTYADSISPKMNERFRAAWIPVLRQEKLLDAASFNLDFHTIPFFGEDEFVERHYLSKRSRSQKSIPIFLAQDADSQVICYSLANLLKREQADSVLRFIAFGKDTCKHRPAALVFDSKLTTYQNLDRLWQMGITFMTLRRRSPQLLREIANTPRSAWRTVHLDVPHRMYHSPSILDRRIQLPDYQGPIRQIFITNLGHEEHTILFTNDLTRSAAQRITRYARRMLIENTLADSVDFFHLDALSSAIRIKVDFDVTLTEVASGLYRSLHFLDTPAQIDIQQNRIEVTLPKRAHNPLLIAAGYGDKSTPVHWWDNHRLALKFR